MDGAVDRLAAAYRDAGLGPIATTSGVDAVLAEISGSIAPVQLPVELERFWRRVDPTLVRVAPYPRPIAPEFALRTWRRHWEESPGMTPRMLFPVAYESHAFLF